MSVFFPNWLGRRVEGEQSPLDGISEEEQSGEMGATFGSHTDWRTLTLLKQILNPFQRSLKNFSFCFQSSFNLLGWMH